VVVLILAATTRWPYFFYVLLRLIICASSAFIASRQYAVGKTMWVWVFGAVACLYNPVLPIRMSRPDWQVINILTAIFFALWLAVRTFKAAEKH
jgi:hypothetical protein